MTKPTAAEDTVRIERTMRAPPERVFQAFLDPDLVRQWLSPADLTIDLVEWEGKVGGKIRVDHSRKGESTGSFQGEFLRIEPNRELVYRWAFVGTEPEKGEFFDTLVTVTLRPLPGGKTRVLIVNEKLADLRERAPQIFAQFKGEWMKSLDLIERALQSPANRSGNWPRSGAGKKES